MTYLLSALDEPTCYRASEESGMKMDLQTTQPSTALLCKSVGVDTPETKSLCCAAAGIIAPLRATAGALIPHEKLRGAALADATLNAQERPPAQPVVGYKASFEVLSDLIPCANASTGENQRMEAE